MTPVCFLVFVAAATPNTQLLAAEDLVAQVRYADAEKALTQARAQPGNARETLLRILELQGIVAGTLGQAPRASKFFQQLLALQPDRRLAEGLPPRVRTPYYEAKGIASEVAPMLFTASADMEGPVLRAKLSADPATLARKARFHVREVGGAWKVTDKPIASGAAALSPGSGRFEWWVELLGEHDATLFSAGSDDKPFVDGVAAAKPVPVPVAVAVAPSSDVPVAIAAPASSPGVHPAVWVCAAGAGAAAVGGVVAGVLSRGNAGKVENPQKDAAGLVTGMTQREAAGLRDQARTQAIAANVLFGSAVALAGTGLAIFLFSGPSKVAVIPGPGGVVFAGALP